MIRNSSIHLEILWTNLVEKRMVHKTVVYIGKVLVMQLNDLSHENLKDFADKSVHYYETIITSN